MDKKTAKHTEISVLYNLPENWEDETVCSRHYCGEAACFPFFMPESWVGWTFGWTFGWTDVDLQKRKVLIGWTFGWTLLTFLKADK